jgi:hypothetical protein
MKDHFIKLFDATHLRKTIIFLVIAAMLVLFSLLTGISDNIPMIALLLAGMVFFFFALLYPWNKIRNFAIFTVTCLAILVADFLWPFISEGFAMTVGMICFAGVITGIMGIIIVVIRIKS